MKHEPKEVVRRYYEEIGNQRRASVADEIIAPDFKLFPYSQPPYGPEGVKRFMKWLLVESFPDLAVTIDKLIAEGETVAASVTLRASHTVHFSWFSQLGSFKPSGQRFELKEFVFWHVVDGKITERDILIDRWGVAEQLGLFGSA